MSQDNYLEAKNGFYYCNVLEDKDTIGVGSFANIYKGLYKQKGSQSVKPVEVAIKYLNSFHIDNTNTGPDIKNNSTIGHKLLLDEIKIMESLRLEDGAVLQLLDYDFDKPSDHEKCIILERANCTLADLLYHPDYSELLNYERKSCSLLKIELSWLIDCFEGLNFIHSKNIIHHDIKPDNIFYFASSTKTGIGRMKIGDFGLSHTSSHAILCTSLKTNDIVKKICEQKPISPKSSSNHHQKHGAQYKNSTTTASTITATTTNSTNNNKGTKSVPLEIEIAHVDPVAVCKGQSVYQPPELFFYPPKCTCSVDVYGMIVVLNEVLSGRKPACDDCHSPRTALLRNVLHSAGSLPMQICGGIRPYLYDGKREKLYVTKLNMDVTATTTTANTTDAIAVDNELNSSVPVDKKIDNHKLDYSPPSAVLQRIQHLIRAGWTTKITDRLVAKGVVTSLQNILKMLNEQVNDDDISEKKSTIDVETSDILKVLETLMHISES